MSELNTKLKIAREMFAIQDFPGDLFSFISKENNYIDKYQIVLFKEDLDKLHGFIAYEDNYTYIGINHKRPIGLQNLTLAHELGHRFLHMGTCFSDNNIESAYQKDAEGEAFDFGFQLLYPNACFDKDHKYIMDHSLFSIGNYRELGIYINDLCHKYFMSFTVILRSHLFKEYKVNFMKAYMAEINKALGMKYTALDTNFYIAKNSHV